MRYYAHAVADVVVATAAGVVAITVFLPILGVATAVKGAIRWARPRTWQAEGLAPPEARIK